MATDLVVVVCCVVVCSEMGHATTKTRAEETHHCEGTSLERLGSLKK